MKTISSRFLKGAVAVLLAVLMVFGSTLTGFAAVIENAETKANVDVAETGANLTYYLVPTDDWKSSSDTFQIYVSKKKTDYNFEQIGTSGIYSVSLPDDVSGTCYVKRYSSGSKLSEFSTTIYTDGRDTFYNTGEKTGILGRSFKPGSTIYLGVNSNWKTDGARFAAYFATPHDQKTTWVSAEQCTNDKDCYKVTVPDTNALTLLIWCRMNPSSTSNDWDNKWNQTGNLGAQSPNDKFTLSSGSWDKGTWSKHPVYVKATFKDYNGDVLKEEFVESGKIPTAPANPSRTGYYFAGWDPAVGAITADTTYTATYTLNPPLTLTLTGSYVASGTSGDGKESNPYIVFNDGSFALTAEASITDEAADVFAVYSTTENGSYTTDNVFNPTPSSFGTKLSQIVYAKAYDGTLYSTSKNATAYYMAFHHLNSANITFDSASEVMTEVEKLTLSGAKIIDIDSTESQYIKFTYQVLNSANGTYEDIDGTVWSPSAIGTYSFRVKAYNEKTKETEYSTTTKTVEVKKSEVDLNVINEGSVDATVDVFADGTLVTNKIPGNSKVTVSVTRPNSNYYIQYIKINDTVISDFSNLNGDISEYLAVEQIKSALTIKYKIALKPTVAVSKDANAQSISFEYFVDGVKKTGASAITYYVDFGKAITYTVTPQTGYYVSAMEDVDIGTITSSTVTGTNLSVEANLTVSATLTQNNTFTVNVDNTSFKTDGASMIIDGTAYGFGETKPLNYGTPAEVVITPPENCYALVSDADAVIDAEGKATFNVTLTGSDKTYTVKFVENPRIFMDQPRYGSIYVNDDLGNYYFNGDYVGYNTELNVNVVRDHNSANITGIKVGDSTTSYNDSSAGSQTKIFNITTETTVSATITVKHGLNDNANVGKRRIFFTDNKNWSTISVEYSTGSTSSSVTMSYAFNNGYEQGVYYADIPVSATKVRFYSGSSTTNQATVSSENNAFYTNYNDYTCQEWNLTYSDFAAFDREESRQQGVTVKGEPAVFEYRSDYGDEVLSAEKVAGNPIVYSFKDGVLSITPTENNLSYSLVKVTSSMTGTVKYYLIKVENFEIVSFSGLRKIYKTSVINNIQLDLILKGGVLNYAASLFISDSNKTNSFDDVSDFTLMYNSFVKHESLEEYSNSFLIQYQLNTMSGVKYYKVEATDGANHKATETIKTLFGTNEYEGTRCVYFYNKTNMNLSSFNVRACFNNGDSHSFVTMQRVGTTNYYRAVIPKRFDVEDSTVNFYLCNPNTFSNDYNDYDGLNDTIEIYSFGALGVNIPEVEQANIVYQVTSIDDTGIHGEFSNFDY